VPSEWLNSWVEKGAVKKLYQEPIADRVRVPGRGQEPHPQHWRFRKGEIEAAILNDPFQQFRRSLTADPGPSVRPWIGQALACAMVADAGGFDQDRAAAWLRARSLRPNAPLRTRFAPQTLAAAERKSERERHRKGFFPHLNTIFHAGDADVRKHPGCCLWRSPIEEALATGKCSVSGLTLAQVEWHADELGAMLACEPPTDAERAARCGTADAGAAELSATVAPPEPAAVAAPPGQEDDQTSTPRGNKEPAEAMWRVMGETCMWLLENGEPTELKTITEYMQKRLAVHNLKRHLSYVTARAAFARDTYRAYRSESLARSCSNHIKKF
jgi:hypothetical protein